MNASVRARVLTARQDAGDYVDAGMEWGYAEYAPGGAETPLDREEWRSRIGGAGSG